MRSDNPTLGTIPCECGRLADVKQRNGRQRRFLYIHCPDCGADQRTGKAVQSRIWFNTAWREGLKPSDPPKNVDDAPAALMQTEPETLPEPNRSEAETLEEFDPDAIEPEPEPKPEQTRKGGKFLKGAAGAAGLLLIVTGLIRSL